MLKISRYNLYYPDFSDGMTLVFNTLSKCIVSLPPDLADGIRNLGSHSVKQLSLSEKERSYLEKAGILVRADLNEIIAMQYARNLAKFRGNEMHLTVILSPRCNFDCTYCWQDMRTGERDMTMEQWKVLLAYVSRLIQDTGVKKLGIMLFGGEPLMNASVALQAAEDVRALESKGVAVSVVLVTNGSLLNSANVAQFARFIDTVQITLDGPEERHNRLRPFADGRESFQSVMNGLQLCIKSTIPNVMLRTNFEPEDYETTREFIRDLSRTLPHISKVSASFSPIFPALSSLKNGCFLGNVQGRKLALDLLLEALDLGFRNRPFGFSSGPCPAQASNNLIVDQDLGFFRCLLQMSDDPLVRLRMDGSLEILRNEWLGFSNQEPECVLSCVYGPICHGGCPALPTDKVGSHECRFRDQIEATLEGLLRVHIRALSPPDV